MVKYLISIFLVLILNTSQAQTEIGGGIFESETWDLSGSPYIIKQNTVIFTDVILTIEPGVQIKFEDDVNLRIQGELIALGTITDVISFASMSPNPTSSSWGFISCEFQSRLVFEYVDFRHSEFGLQFNHLKPSYISNSNFELNELSISTEGGTSSGLSITSTTFQNNNFGIYGVSGLEIRSCTFDHNNFGAQMARATIDSCLFRFNDSIGLSGTTSIIQHSKFENNNIGLEQSFSGGSQSSHMTKNTIYNNTIGLKIIGNNPLAVFTENTICNNSDYNVVNTSSFSGHDLSNNCWCTEDLNLIAESIFDAHEDISVGVVTYEPIQELCDNITSVTNHSLNKILIFPNPVSTYLYINQTSQLKFSIISMEGKIMLAGTTVKKINMSKIPSGIYILNIEDSSGQKSYFKIFKTEFQ